MPSVSHGRRNVLGLVTLVLACLCVAGWVSSIRQEVCLYLTQKDRTPFMVVSRDHYLCVVVAHHSIPLESRLGPLWLGWRTGDSTPESNEAYWTLVNFDSPEIKKSHWYLGPLCNRPQTEERGTGTFSRINWNSQCIDEGKRSLYRGKMSQSPVCERLRPILLGTNTDTTPTYQLTNWFVAVPYWLIGVPLTIPAGWLLLSQPLPRPSQSKALTDC
ncbi:hypothetical protein [Schlesneria paludicola]|uniref:hypothetical protein n=1 Tax=Schlesneria paludicola TaxID=360056 RepID=UPI00029A3EDF|nr:hypothetical protein [Schlesneria paludicola]